MGRSVGAIDIVDQAASVAASVAESAGVRVEELTRLDHLAAAAALFDEVWSGDTGQMPLGLLRALSFSENYVAGAFSGDELIGAASGFKGGSVNDPHLHSHILGVLPGKRSHNVGYALKMHQRAWALSRGLGSIVWTFDPLVAKNAYFNLTKLGAETGKYIPNFYGEMRDAQNFGGESDRLVVHWMLESEKALAASRGESREPEIADLLGGRGAVALDQDDRGLPVMNGAIGPTVLFKVPEDIVELRRKDPALGRQWRTALRETFGEMLGSGAYENISVAKSGWYVLST